MSGAILGGASVERAAKLQMIIMFMIAASNALACIITTIATLMVVVDAEHRVRGERVDSRPHLIWRIRKVVVMTVVATVQDALRKCDCAPCKKTGQVDAMELM